MITGYKLGKIQHMNADLWHAKKVVDSTLHPGTVALEGEQPWGLIECRYRRTCPSSLQNVMLCTVKFGGHCGHAHTRTSGMQAHLSFLLP